jgi:hypothetical protein
MSIVRSRHGAAEDEEVGGAGRGGLAVEDLPQGLALIGIGALVDDHLLAPVSICDLSRPLEQDHVAQAVQAGLVEVPLIDVSGGDRLAEAVRRR